MHALWFQVLKDTARRFFYRFSRMLGETLHEAPESLVEKEKARTLLRVELKTLCSLLPYESVDGDVFFINHASIGFGFLLTPLASADASTMHALAALFQTKLPTGVDCTFMLYKHAFVGEALFNNFKPIIEKGGIYGELAKRAYAFHLEAATNGYACAHHVDAQLADYGCYVFVSMPRASGIKAQVLQLRLDFIAEFKAMGLPMTTLDCKTFQQLVRSLTSPNLNATSWPSIPEHSSFAASMVDKSLSIVIEDRALAFTLLDERGAEQSVSAIACELTGLSKTPFALWENPSLYANALHPEQGIPCPFVISFSIKGLNQEAMKRQARRHSKSLEANANAIQKFLNPHLDEELADWTLAYQETVKGNMHFYNTVYTVMLLTKKEHARSHLAKAIASFRQFGFTLTPSPYQQWLRYLGCLPFCLSEGLFKSFETLAMTRRMNQYNVANLLPIVADSKGSSIGLVLPTYRHQLFFYSPFDDVHLPITNYNRLTVAAPGAGKSYLQLALLQDAQSRGQMTFVIDLGGSYKHLCDLVGGTYIDARSLSLNPFTLFDLEGVTMIGDQKINDSVQLRDLLAIMASPNEPLTPVQNSWLLEVVLDVCQSKGSDACMDDVLTALKKKLATQGRDSDSRLQDLITLLQKYATGGLYGAMFNQKAALWSDASFVVLEMGGFQDNQELLTILMFVMIVIIQGQFYQTDRRIKKQCVIDEAWRFLANGSNPIAAQFLEQGFRTARKYNGGFSVVTQLLSDTTQSLQGRAIAASSDTKIYMRQGAFKEFLALHPHGFTQDQIAMIQSFGEAKLQGFSSLMMTCGTTTTFHRFFTDPFLSALFSSSGDEYGAIEALVAQGVSITEAVMRVVDYGSQKPCIPL